MSPGEHHSVYLECHVTLDIWLPPAPRTVVEQTAIHAPVDVPSQHGARTTEACPIQGRGTIRVGTRERLSTLFATPPRKVWLSPFSCAPMTIRSQPSLTEKWTPRIGQWGK